MTDLYTPEGVLDYAAAARDLAGIPRLTNARVADATVATVSAAALLDIAVSLNRLVVLAEGAEFPLGSDAPDEVGPDGEPMGDPQRETDDPIDEAPLEVGERVVVRPETIIVGENVADLAAGGVVLALGVSEGEEWAEVSFDVDEGEEPVTRRVWAAALMREPIPDAVAETLAHEADPEVFDEPDARDAVEGIDDDFGPATPVAEAPRCEAPHPTVGDFGPLALCARKAGHDGKHRKGNLKWA